MPYMTHELVDLFSKQWEAIKEDIKQGRNMIRFEFRIFSVNIIEKDLEEGRLLQK